MAALMSLAPCNYIANPKEIFDPAKAVSIGMNRAGVTYPESAYPALGTENIASCMGLAVHCPATGATGLAHLAQQEGQHLTLSKAGERTLRAMLNEMRGENFEARIFGPKIRGVLADDFIDDVVDVLAEYKANILSADFRGKETPSKVAVHAALWNQGVIRGSINVFDLISKGAKSPDIQRQLSEMVNLDNMAMVGMAGEELVYNGRRDVNLFPTHGMI